MLYQIHSEAVEAKLSWCIFEEEFLFHKSYLLVKRQDQIFYRYLLFPLTIPQILDHGLTTHE